MNEFTDKFVGIVGQAYYLYQPISGTITAYAVVDDIEQPGWRTVTVTDPEIKCAIYRKLGDSPDPKTDPAVLMVDFTEDYIAADYQQRDEAVTLPETPPEGYGSAGDVSFEDESAVIQ